MPTDNAWTFARPMPVPSKASALCRPLKDAKELAGVLCIKAHAVVTDIDHGFRSPCPANSELRGGRGDVAG